MISKPPKQWGGRFARPTHSDVEEYTFSLDVDGRLWEADLQGSQAHAAMLGEQGILPRADAKRIVDGLGAVREGLHSGKLKLPDGAEDVHSAIESLLGEQIGELAGKLHTGRSRNDQVATATRLYLRGECDAFDGELKQLQQRLLAHAEAHLETILPGLTHMQHAQPVTLAHHLMAFFWMFARDRARLADARKRINELPLGSAALAGTSFRLDREAVARALGFESVCENSLDAVSDRDFAVEFLASANLAMSHLSRLAEELVLWSSPAFGYLELDDEVTTGSSIMPQKKNPDVAELIRGRSGRLTGSLMGLLTTLKALPLSYNRDLQEDKVHLFSGLDTVRSSTRLMELMLSKARFSVARMRAAVEGDFSNATDLADYLVRKGLPFRQAHEVIGRAVRLALGRGVALEALALAELKALHPLFEADALAVLDPLAVVRSRATRGGTAPDAVRAQIARAREVLAKGAPNASG